MLAGIVIVITAVAPSLVAQDTATHKDSSGRRDSMVPAVAAPAPPPAPAPTVEQIRYMEGLRTATRGVAQIRDGLNRVARTQQARDSLTRRRAARRLGGLCGTARTFILSGRPRMQPSAYADSMRIIAKQLVTRLDSLTNALPACEKTAGHDPATVATDLTKRLSAYDDALLAFRNAQNRPDSAKSVSQQQRM
jgi:hypothetical protein